MKILGIVLWLLATPAFALGGNNVVRFGNDTGALVVASGGKAAPLHLDPQDWPGVIRAARDLQADIQRVSGALPALKLGPAAGKQAVIVGTIGRSALVDQLIASGKLDASSIRGKWEGWMMQTIDNPMPGVSQALVIAGSDKRGTIYGIYELSEQIGVSPWYWWADVPPVRHATIAVSAAQAVSDAPVVQYRGIFLNDEAPALTGWAKQRYGGYNHRFYEKVFELILRLRGNYLWPAMWDAAFFDDDPLNGKLADEYGIVMGTSHHEPMMRAQKAWHRHGTGPWDYQRNEQVLKDFWRGGLRNTRDYEKVFTLGMRGDGDEPMSEESNVALLQRIVRDQREMITQEINPRLSEVPQAWALYKEVQEYYEKGMRVPDDVLLLWCDDNWGNIRRLPTAEERKRPGGAGVYYHFDYVGGPRSYKWLNVTPLPKVWEQMHLAWKHEATRMWIVNVGDLKPMEVPIEFFLSYAWNPAKWPAERLPEYLKLWAAREFGQEYAADIADIVSKYTRYNSRRRPEMLEPTTYSLLNYREAERVVEDYKTIAKRAQDVSAKLPAARRDAFFQLVLHPVQAGAVLNEMMVSAGQNRLYAKQGRASANALAERVRALFREDAALTRRYHTINGGKWNHMMSQTHLGYTYWNQPPRNVMPAVTEIQLPEAGDMGVAVEGSEQVWPGPGGDALAVPTLEMADGQPRFIDVFNRGSKPFAYSIRSDQRWLKVSQTKGAVTSEQRVWISANWNDVPEGEQQAMLTVSGPDGAEAKVRVPVRKQHAAPGFTETNGVVSIEAEHYARALASAGRQWLRVPDHGRTLSGMTSVEAGSAGAEQASHLEYPVVLHKAGEVTVQVTLAPTLKFQPGQGLRYGISFDDEPPQIVNVHADQSLAHWEKIVGDGAAQFTSKHRLPQAGAHTLKFWAVDPGLVVQKLVIDAGGLEPSYLGPPESPRK
ncbi:glycosyl hydrolase 115 family protein [Massilia endophytica]|uniref:glycosyl hydrolase 115 family protein n=1 Tax=Massilia endophytica TaxID=2899220 RepID=UPI001E346B4F|nr:glycosyl hydrolase 115 family protein [Massilia endophytica]UGQ47589.1 glycosyl hydrolase 115 family protein [Massilia endophytica]